MPRRILALDGGGIRGVFTAAFLAHIERGIGRPLIEQFDLLTGTSTGSIVALALSTGMPAQAVLEAYKQAGPDIFPRRSSVLSRLFGPAHDNRPLRAWLQSVLGERRLADARLRVVIPTLDVATGSARVWKTDHHPELHGGGDRLMWEVALASAAAPTYLPSVQIEGKGAYVDGGLWANNPAIVGIVEAVRYLGCPLTEIRMLSVGTGRRPKWARFRDVERRGTLRWGAEFLEVVFAAQSAAADHQARLLLRKEDYLRVDPDLAREIALDDVTEVGELEHLGETEGLRRLNEVRRLLASTVECTTS